MIIPSYKLNYNIGIEAGDNITTLLIEQNNIITFRFYINGDKNKF